MALKKSLIAAFGHESKLVEIASGTSWLATYKLTPFNSNGNSFWIYVNTDESVTIHWSEDIAIAAGGKKPTGHKILGPALHVSDPDLIVSTIRKKWPKP